MSEQHLLIGSCALLVTLIVAVAMTNAQNNDGSECTFLNAAGTCRNDYDCEVLMKAFQNNQITSRDIKSCGFNLYGELVCCPNDNIFSVPAPDIDDRLDGMRPADKACKEYYEGRSASLHINVLDGTPVDLGEYPHLAAIGFSQIGGSPNNLAYSCGGTLIHEKFILTAAHCLVKRGQTAVSVRMGVTNFLDPIQMAKVVEIKIAKQHIHPDYVSSKKYNDIALLELERNVDFTKNVYPTCLYTQNTDPVGSLHVAGWGVTDVEGERKVSTKLLKAQLILESLDSCNATYTTGDIPRSISLGLIESQLCAFDPGHTKDACQGDSGGPLQLDVDVSRTQYKVVGIVSAGFDCGTRTPALYTRVYSYLDYIEKIVWPKK